jgi:hypothetical protein
MLSYSLKYVKSFYASCTIHCSYPTQSSFQINHFKLKLHLLSALSFPSTLHPLVSLRNYDPWLVPRNPYRSSFNGAGVSPNVHLHRHPRPALHVNAATTNDTDGAVDPPTRRKRAPASEETKKKMSESRKGAQHSEETKLKISQAMKNRPPRAIGE